MSQETKFDRLTNEVVSGGTQREADAKASKPVTIAALVGWVVILAVLWWYSPWVVVFTLGIFVSIVLHELGHFWTARRSGMRATQFFFGFGPRLWSVHRNGTEFGVRLIPLGGFVKIIGMTNVDEVAPEDEAQTYRQGTYPRRMWVITAGSVMHLIIAMVLIVGVYGIWGRVEEAGRVTVHSVSDNTPAATAGLQPDDVVLAIDGTAVATAEEFRTTLASTTPGTTVTLDVQRGDEQLQLEATLVQSPSAADGEVRGYLGVTSDSTDRVPQSWGDALVEGPKDLVTGVGQAVSGVARIMNPVNVFGHLVGTNDDLESRPGTVVGAAKVTKDAGEFDGWAGVLSVLAAINVSIGVLNMFPLVPLDGGHAAIATYERIREGRSKKRYFVDMNKLMPVAAMCLTLIAFMFLTGLYLDVAN
ncbi:MAG: site-2 protease family protein [Actinobacteria bacterium]|nr:site-2 protease family protein [Actinomycetota bacterium]